jgi:hypothetical protein
MNFDDLTDKVTLTLSCEKCGDINRYEVKSVVMGRNGVGPLYFVGDEIQMRYAAPPAVSGQISSSLLKLICR